MRSQTSASVFGASDEVFMGSILPQNRTPLQENAARARPYARFSNRLFRAASRDGGQVVHLFKKTLLQAVVAQLLRQDKEAVWIFDEMAADDLWCLAFDLSCPVVEGHRAGRCRRRLLDFLATQGRAVARFLVEL